MEFEQANKSYKLIVKRENVFKTFFIVKNIKKKWQNCAYFEVRTRRVQVICVNKFA